MTPLPEAVSPEALPIYAVDDDGEILELLGTGARAGDGVVLVEGRLAERLAADAWTLLRVAVPAAPADGSREGVRLVEVGTVHVADPEKVTRIQGRDGAEPGATAALELVGGAGVLAGRGTATGEALFAMRSANVLCVLFGNLLRICRR